jgi:hypothetical protein
MKTKFLLIVIVAIVFANPSMSSVPGQPAPDDSKNVLRDDFLNNLAGDWKLTRKMHGQMSQSTVHAEWVLNHQFLFLHMREMSTPSQYEAMIYIGYDQASERYVAHWIDIFGGRVSETLGYGTRAGNTIKLRFEYPEGPFNNTLTWRPETTSWTSFMEQKDKGGKWAVFAEDQLSRG